MSQWLHARSQEAVGSASLPLRLTALLLLLDPMPVWYLRALLVVLVGLGLLFPVILRAPATWLVVALVEAARIVRLWPTADHHHHLLFYWCLAIFLALILADPRGALATAGRWLLAALFLWAVIWKVALSPGYLDGRFFTVQLVTDGRFEETTRILTGMSAADLERSREYLAIPSPDGEGYPEVDRRPAATDALPAPASLRRVAALFTWGTLLFQAALALLFLWPGGSRIALLRHGLLLTFVLLTYLAVPIPLFGPLVLLMGLAVVEPDRPGLRAGYVALWFLVIGLLEFPRSHLLSALRRLGLA